VSVAIDRMPPANIDAEQAVLGSCLMDPGAAARAAAVLASEAVFTRPAHVILWRAILRLMEVSIPYR